MKQLWRRLVLSVAISGVSAFATAEPTVQSPPAQTADVGVEQLKTEAFAALRLGQFERVNTLITQAASISNDPNLAQMRDWVAGFEKQRDQFRGERKKSFDDEVAKVHKLIEAKMPDYALRAAATAYTYAEDKAAFRAEPWVVQLVEGVGKRADEYEANREWLKAVRVYSDLVVIEPFDAAWKDKQKLAFRRVRLINLFTPEAFKELQESDAAERLAADRVLDPTTRPTTAPAMAATKPDEGSLVDDESFKIDWHDALVGVRLDMLRDALDHAKANYWRDVNYDLLVSGGLGGVKAVLTTPALVAAFPKLGDEAAVKEMIAVVDRLAAVTGAADRGAVQRVLEELREANKRTVQLPDEVLVSEFADGAFAELDPFSSVIWPSEVAEFTKITQGEFSGVGIQIQADLDGGLKVVSPLEDSPAFRAKIRAGDIITHVNGKNARGVTVNQAVKIITGPPGSEVTLTIRSPDGSSRDLTLARQTIKVASLKGWLHRPGGGWDYLIDPENKIAYLRLTSFAKDTSRELATAIKDLNKSGAKGIVLDLRYNPGGLLSAATEVSDAFLKDGTIVSTKSDRPDDPNEPVLVAHKSSSDSDLPLVVLVNQYSASASEIVSGAMRDRKRAVIVGERTFGKGSVQMLFPLANRSAMLKLTTSHYYLPGGTCIHRDENSTTWGVDPDVLVEMTPEQMRDAIDARSQLDVLRESEPDQAPDKAAIDTAEKSLLASDPQLTAAVLLLRLHIAGAPLM